MTRNAAAADYRQTRRAYLALQNARCTRYGKPATAATFDAEAGAYLREICGITAPTPEDWTRAAKALLAHLRGDDGEMAVKITTLGAQPLSL